MADQFRYKLMTDLTAKADPSDTDLVAVGNNGSSALRKLTFASIANAIKTKLASWQFTNLTTSSKTLPGAVNELNSKINFTSQVTWSDATPTSGYCSFLKCGNWCVVLFDFTSPSTVTSDKVIATLPSGYYAMGRNVCTVSKAWARDSTAIIHILENRITMAATAWEANTRYVGVCTYLAQ